MQGQKKSTIATSQLDDLADLDDLMEGGETAYGDLNSILTEAFLLVFKDDFTSFSSAMHHAFNDTV